MKDNQFLCMDGLMPDHGIALETTSAFLLLYGFYVFKSGFLVEKAPSVFELSLLAILLVCSVAVAFICMFIYRVYKQEADRQVTPARRRQLQEVGYNIPEKFSCYQLYRMLPRKVNYNGKPFCLDIAPKWDRYKGLRHQIAYRKGEELLLCEKSYFRWEAVLVSVLISLKQKNIPTCE